MQRIVNLNKEGINTINQLMRFIMSRKSASAFAFSGEFKLVQQYQQKFTQPNKSIVSKNSVCSSSSSSSAFAPPNEFKLVQQYQLAFREWSISPSEANTAQKKKLERNINNIDFKKLLPDSMCNIDKSDRGALADYIRYSLLNTGRFPSEAELKETLTALNDVDTESSSDIESDSGSDSGSAQRCNSI